ncbi:MAG: hypothetical protein ACJ8MR_16505, partial [Povalibacter sp.]
RHRHRRLKKGAPMNSPLERARLLDAEMQLQRAWLELNLRELSSAEHSPWAKLNALKLGAMGASLLKHKSLWVAGLSLLTKLYRRRARKEHA